MRQACCGWFLACWGWCYSGMVVVAVLLVFPWSRRIAVIPNAAACLPRSRNRHLFVRAVLSPPSVFRYSRIDQAVKVKQAPTILSPARATPGAIRVTTARTTSSSDEVTVSKLRPKVCLVDTLQQAALALLLMLSLHRRAPPLLKQFCFVDDSCLVSSPSPNDRNSGTYCAL